MAAFSQFASDLDPETQKQLARGVRLVQMLIQKPNQPLPFHQQAALIFAGTNGYFDTLEPHQIATYESTMYEKLNSSYKELSDSMLKDKKLTDEIKD